MCCFSGPVEHVSGTRIFARANGDRQLTAYQMTFAAAGELAMVLPLPVPVGSDEQAVRFIDLSKDPWFFSNLHDAFEEPVRGPMAAALSTEGAEEELALAVVDVGAFEASFVPSLRDFGRLDVRFRLAPEVVKNLPGSADWGFVVFKLRASPGAPHEVHPMAFDFPTRQPGRLFFPCIHVHDGSVHAEAEFDHHLYAQVPQAHATHDAGWERSLGVLGEFLTDHANHGLVSSTAFGWTKRLAGVLPNRDVWLEPAPETAEDAEARAKAVARLEVEQRDRLRRQEAARLERERWEAEQQKNARLSRIGRTIVGLPVSLCLGYGLFVTLSLHLHGDRGATPGAAIFSFMWLASFWFVANAISGKARDAWIATLPIAAALGVALTLMP